MQGSIEERILKRGRDSQGKMRVNLKVYDVRYSYMDIATGKLKKNKKERLQKEVRGRGIFIRNKSTSK